jgi:hypothetical protein
MYFTIPLFLLWANLHGQFILGFGLFGIWILLYILQLVYFTKKEKPMKRPNNVKEAVKNLQTSTKLFGAGLIKNKKEIVNLVIIFAACLIATIVNPFGWGIHAAALSHVGSPLLQNIAEYLPFDVLSVPWWNQVIAGVLLAFGFLALFFRDKIMNKLPLLGAGIILFLFSFEVRRYAWPAYYLILPLLTPLSVYLKPDNKKMTQTLASIFACILLITAVASRYPFTQFSSYSWDAYCTETKCSPKAVDFLIQNKLTENVYTLYGWGGWLIWNYPEVKPVIDGRMHLWSQNGYSAFEEYYAIEQNFKDIDATEYNTVLISPDKPLHERLIKLENAGKWKMVYHDTNASVFVRK